MPKKNKITTFDIEKSIMEKIKSEEIIMKPRWYFILGAVLSFTGLISFGIVTVFLTNLTIFLLKQHGPNGQWRLQQIVENFPFWVPMLALAGMTCGIWMLKKFDFSYKKNFKSIILMIIVAIIITAFILDYTGLDNIWMKQGPMRRFYQQNQNSVITPISRGNGHGSGGRQRNIYN